VHYSVQVAERKNAKGTKTMGNPAMVAMAAAKFKKGGALQKKAGGTPLKTGTKPRSALGKRSENCAKAANA
jgi:hypothetical protein